MWACRKLFVYLWSIYTNKITCKALVHAHLATKENLFSHKAVALSTYGIIFLGTPHQGTQSAELASILLDIQAITRPVNDALVKHLSRNSEALEQQLSQFVSISKDFVIKFGFERYPTPYFGGFRGLVSYFKKRTASRDLLYWIWTDCLQSVRCRAGNSGCRSNLHQQEPCGYVQVFVCGRWRFQDDIEAFVYYGKSSPA